MNMVEKQIRVCLYFTLISGFLALFGIAAYSSDFVEHFDDYQFINWSDQLGLHQYSEYVPVGAKVSDGVATFGDAMSGVTITSSRKFLYGTFEARVKIKASGYQYIGFMSRAPWGANGVNLMSDNNGWRLMSGRDKVGGDSGITATVVEEWAVIKIVWTNAKISFYVDDVLKGEITDQTKIPQTPIPIILDTYAAHPMMVDWIKVTGSQDDGQSDAILSTAQTIESNSLVKLESLDWIIKVNKDNGYIGSVTNLKPNKLLWTPTTSAGMVFYVRNLPDGSPIIFQANGNRPKITKSNIDGDTYDCIMTLKDPLLASRIKGRLKIKVLSQRVDITAIVTALSDIKQPMEIGVGLPFTSANWNKQVFPRLPWLALSVNQDGQIRFPFMTDPNDATLPSSTGNWIFYPMGLLQRDDRTVLWGGMDIGRRIVLSPNNFGSLPSITLAPKSLLKGETKALSLTLKNTIAPNNYIASILKWYLSNCYSSDPLTSDLFPVKDWTPRVFPNGGGVGMPDTRLSELNPKYDPVYWAKVRKTLKDFSVTNLWYASFAKMDGSYPISGSWMTGTGLQITAESFKFDVDILKKDGLYPCLYTWQFIVPELLTTGGIPDKNWTANGSDGNLSLFDRFTAGENRSLGDFFTKDLAEKIGTNVITWAYGDYGRAEYRKWLMNSLKAAVDYYHPSGICFDYGWAGMGPYNTYSPGNPNTSQAHGRLRVQADMYKWLKTNHPEMLIICNDIPGSPSQLFANCMLLESSEQMSDIDFQAGKALGSAMSSMDYFGDHNKARWTRQMMLDLARGCSMGLPFWIATNPPESEYIAKWTKFMDFSGRATQLPLTANPSAIAADQSDIIGSIWTKGIKFMSAVYDRRIEGQSRLTTVTLILPTNSIQTKSGWQIIHLNSDNLDLPASKWIVKRVNTNLLNVSGQLAPGEMILIETITR